MAKKSPSSLLNSLKKKANEAATVTPPKIKSGVQSTNNPSNTPATPGASAKNGGGRTSDGVVITKDIQDSVITYFRNINGYQMSTIEFRQIFEEIDREIARTAQRNQETVQAKIKNNLGDKSQQAMADLTVPVMFPQMQAALAYFVGIFITGDPIFPLVSEDPVTEEQAHAYNAVISENAKKTGWKRQLTLFLWDALRYNFAAVEVDWKKCNTYSLVNDTDPASQAPIGSATKKTLLWQGNAISRIDPYNIIFDTRVAPGDIHTDGEFAGYTKIYSRIALKKFVAELPWNMNVAEAFATVCGQGVGNLYYVPTVTNKLNLDPRTAEFNWMNWFNPGSGDRQSAIRYSEKGAYEVTTLYVRILPSDFGLNVPAKNSVQIWKLIIVNGTVLIFMERQTNAHDYLPIVFCQPLEDGLNYQTKSFAENLKEIQNMASQLWNIKINGARRIITDRMLYDPSRVRPEDINSSAPNAKIPVRPSAYGQDLGKSVYPFPYNDTPAQNLVNDALQVVDLGRTVTGINAPQEGTFIKGNRTSSEFNTVAANANARLQMMAQFIDDQAFTPIKEIIKINILQYQQPGTYYSPSLKGPVNIDPIALRNMILSYQVADGLEPVSKLVNTDFLQSFMQLLMAQSPVAMALAQQYDIGRMINYIANTQNLDLNNFLRQQQPGQNPAAPGMNGLPNPPVQPQNSPAQNQPPQQQVQPGNPQNQQQPIQQ